MRRWTKILPFFFIEWWAVRNLAKTTVNNKDYVQPYGPGTFDLLTGESFPERITLIEVNPRDRNLSYRSENKRRTD